MSLGDFRQGPVGIDDLPDEVLEFILSQISPYEDLHKCMQVSKRWRRCVLNVAKTKQRNLHRAISEFDIQWSTFEPLKNSNVISSRYSHTAVIHENSMYVFGGCTCYMTTFNDFWRFDLTKRQWERPKTEGMYPSPKACSTFVSYKNLLVLFGGWTYPPSYPLYQSFHLFDELHVYDITLNSWKCITATNSPPPMAGHSVSVIGEWMIVFGGMHKPATAVHCEKSNDIWKLNLETWVWYKQEVEGELKPKGRLGQTQVVLDDHNIMIIGGSGGPGMIYADVWILNMSGDVWKWSQMPIEEYTNRPTHIWTNCGCKIGDKVVILNRIRELQPPPVVYYPKSSWGRSRESQDNSKLARIDLASRKPDRDENVNGKHGVLRNHKREADDDPHQPGCSRNHQRPNVVINNNPPEGQINLAAFIPPQVGATERARMEQQLAYLARIHEQRRKLREDSKKDQYLGIYVLDISKALDVVKPSVTWMPPKNLKNDGPEETIMYTLLKGKSELVMFGGIRKDPNIPGFSPNIGDLAHQMSNLLYFISAPSYVI